MGVFSAFVLFAMIWAMVMLVMLQVKITTQGDLGYRDHGTQASAPETVGLKRRLLWATVIAVPIWALLVWLILSGLIGIDSLPRLSPAPPPGG